MISRRVVVVGDVMLDVVVKPSRDVAATSDTPSRVRLARGGAAANVAEALALDGHHVTFVGACGDDVTSQFFEDALRRSGADVVLERVDRASGVVVALVDRAGERAMMTDRGANSALSLAHVSAQLVKPFDHLHVSGYTVLDPRTTGVASGALERARALGRPTSVDVCSLAPLIALTSASFLEAISGATILFANEEEALMLSSSTDVDSALELLARDFDEVIVTRGRAGARARVHGTDYETDSLSIDVDDTTGAGDAATGGYLSVRLRGGPVDEALQSAMRASSYVVRGLGSRGQSRP